MERTAESQCWILVLLCKSSGCSFTPEKLISYIKEQIFLLLFPTQQDPFGTASSLSPDEHLQAQNQSVCTLRDFLDLAAQHGKLVIFDLYRPPRGHPYRDAWISRTLDVIQNESSIHSSQVCHYTVTFWGLL